LGSEVLIPGNMKDIHLDRGKNDLPLSLHLRMVLSKLVLMIHGSTLVLPSSPTVLRTHRRSPVTSCQCASTSPRSSGSSRDDTSYIRIISPAPVIKYGSARSVSESGRIDLTGKAYVIAASGFHAWDAGVTESERTWTVSSDDAAEILRSMGLIMDWLVYVPVQS
jgi:hypothetical protein